MPIAIIRASIAKLSQALLAFDTRPHEDGSNPIAGLITEILGLGDQAIALLGAVADCDEPGDGFDASSPIVAASDLAFVARLDLLHRATALRGCSAEMERWVVVGQVESLARHILRALAEVERALGPREARSQLSAHHARELEISLASRRAYYQFFRAIIDFEAQLAAGEIALTKVLRLCATNIAMLVGRDIYSRLRVGDRHQLEALRGRLFRWAAEHPDDELGARRLWGDVSSCVTLLRGIHQRPCLVEHDLELFAELLDSQDLRQLDPDRARTLIEAADRDEALHAELRRSTPSFAALEAPLRRAHDQLAASLGRPAHVSPAPVLFAIPGLGS